MNLFYKKRSEYLKYTLIVAKKYIKMFYYGINAIIYYYGRSQMVVTSPTPTL